MKKRNHHKTAERPKDTHVQTESAPSVAWWVKTGPRQTPQIRTLETQLLKAPREKHKFLTKTGVTVAGGSHCQSPKNGANSNSSGYNPVSTVQCHLVNRSLG